MRFERGHQGGERPAADHKVHIIARQHWPQKPDLEIARQVGNCANPQMPAGLPCAGRKGRHHFAGGFKNAIGVIERDAPGLGQFQPASTPFKQFMPDTFFKLADLGGQRRLRNIKAPRGIGQVAIMGNRMKIAQVLEIKMHRAGRPVHACAP